MATHETFRDFVEGHGLDFKTLPGDPLEVLRTERAKRLLGGGGLVTFSRRFLALLRPWFESLATATADVVNSSDVVLYSPLAFTAWHQAEATGLPSVLTTLQPFHPTSEFASVAAGRFDLGVLNRMSHRLTQQLFWQPFRRIVNRWRSIDLALPPLPLSGPYRHLTDLVLCGFSQHIVPRPRDWPGRVKVTGAWSLPDDRPLPDDLEAFIAAGEAPVYAGFGSLVVGDKETLANNVVAAARRNRRRLVMGAGWTGLEASSAEHEEVFVVGDIPHSKLFPRMAAAIHHGGAGTTHTAARAGIPQVVAASYADQPFWAGAVEQAGIGIHTSSPARLDAGPLSAALAAVNRRSTQERAAAVGEAMRAENGVDSAVESLVAGLGLRLG